MAVKSVALSALLAAVASAQRVALYRGTGSSAGSSGNFSAAFKQLVSDGSIASVKELDETGITAAQLTLANFDVVVFPGGGGSAEAGAIGPDGAKAVQAFVTSGGGYYGTCVSCTTHGPRRINGYRAFLIEISSLECYCFCYCDLIGRRVSGTLSHMLRRRGTRLLWGQSRLFSVVVWPRSD